MKGSIDLPGRRKAVIGKLTACLETLGVAVTVPKGLSPGGHMAFLVGALGAAGDALVNPVVSGDLHDSHEEFLRRSAQGYLAALGADQDPLLGMACRLDGYCAVLDAAARGEPDSPTAAARHAMMGVVHLVDSFEAPPEFVRHVQQHALGCFREAVAHLACAVSGCEGHMDDSYVANCLENIEKFGFYTQYVGGDPETGAPPYAYTVGLSAQEAYGYELAVSGLSADNAHGVLWSLVRKLEGDDLTAAEGLEIDEVIRRGKVRLRSASSDGEFGMIEQLLGERSTVWQAVCPDAEGRFPGEAGYGMERDDQHLL